MILEATMKSGAKVRFKCKSFDWDTTVGWKSLGWTSFEAQERDRLIMLDLAEVVAIVRIK